MTIDYNFFIDKFPEFESIDSDIVSKLIENTLIELNYEYIESPQKEQAYCLAIAHYLFLSENLSSENVDPLKFGQLKTVETQNNKVEFAVNSSDLGSWLSTTYGQRLKRILDQYIAIGYGLQG
jgi:hypothetical protein